jgi:predicted nucleic-acid-binding Zn-ribbon protein
MFKCPKCGGRFNHYFDVSPRGKGVEFVIRIGYRE